LFSELINIKPPTIESPTTNIEIDIINILIGDAIGTNVLNGIETWSDDFHYTMNSVTGPSVLVWRELVNFYGSTQWFGRDPTSALSSIDCIALRNHF